MTHPYTAVQLSYLRSALALLAQSVEQANPALPGVAVLDNAQQQPADTVITPVTMPAMPSGTANIAPTPSALANESEKPKAKHLFSGLTRFLKPKDMEPIVPPAPEITEPVQPLVTSELPVLGNSVVNFRTTHNTQAKASALEAGQVDGGSTASAAVSYADKKNYPVPAKVFFAALPWGAAIAVLDNASAAHGDTHSTLTDICPLAESPIAKQYFSDLPWKAIDAVALPLPKVRQANITESNQQHAIPSNLPIVTERVKPMGSYFQTLPWYCNPQPIITDIHSLSATNNDDSASLFTTATQSALRAAQYAVQQANSRQGCQKAQAFLANLPWHHSR